MDKTNHAFLVIGNQVLGGNDFEINGVKAELKYEIDYSKKPTWLDLIIYEKNKPEEKGRIKGIIRFTADYKMEYRVNFDPAAERFENFDSEDEENTIILDKVSY